MSVCAVDVAFMHVNPPDRFSPAKRTLIRVFALLVIFVIVLDTLPRSWGWLRPPKQMLSSVLNRVGLWQGEWPLFAPDPVINNGWFTAEVHAIDGTVTQWSSPYWSEASGWDKFIDFRHVDYFNRLTLRTNAPAADDLADYLACEANKPVARVKLYKNLVTLQMPDDGTLPPRDELGWIFNSEPVSIRRYQP